MADNQLDTRGKRLRFFRKKIGETQEDFAKQLNIPQSYLSQIERDSNNISSNLLTAISEKYPNLNIHWLWTGVGSPKLGVDEVEYEAPLKIITLMEKNMADFEEILKLLKGR